MSYFKRLRQALGRELEAPRSERPFGSGWIAGTLALLAGLCALLLTLALRHPGLLTVPQLSVIRDQPWFHGVVLVLLALAYVLASLSLLLRPSKVLGYGAMAITLLASLLGSLPATTLPGEGSGLFLGLDFFVLNVLFIGFLFVPLERLFPRHAEQTLFRDEWREDLFYYLVSSLFVQILTYLTLVPSRIVQSATTGWADFFNFVASLPWLLQLVLIMVFTDLIQYWVHRAFHQFPFLWRFHAVHHSARSMDWLASARMHFLEIVVLRGFTAIPMFAAGFAPSAVQAYLLIVYLYSAFIHANLRWNLGWMERWLVVPRFHHWHHGVEREAIDVNFAIHFPWLDRLFGTHHMPADRWPEGYGIGGHPVPRGYWRQFLYPFRRG